MLNLGEGIGKGMEDMGDDTGSSCYERVRGGAYLHLRSCCWVARSLV